jgi:hypothetical protein
MLRENDRRWEPFRQARHQHPEGFDPPGRRADDNEVAGFAVEFGAHECSLWIASDHDDILSSWVGAARVARSNCKFGDQSVKGTGKPAGATCRKLRLVPARETVKATLSGRAARGEKRGSGAAVGVPNPPKC